ncbi:hypothetical protein QBC39DRAFT_334171 [Podospora conica]|nr:hypothetical protein QBC39DRAFT_334171 [Schizothecium conicum]
MPRAVHVSTAPSFALIFHVDRLPFPADRGHSVHSVHSDLIRESGRRDQRATPNVDASGLGDDKVSLPSGANYGVLAVEIAVMNRDPIATWLSASIGGIGVFLWALIPQSRYQEGAIDALMSMKTRKQAPK